MNIDTLITALADAIASDATLTAWANATYGRDHKVYVNMDQKGPPEADDCPFVVIVKSSKTEGQAIDPRSHAFLVRCAVYDEEMATPAHANMTVYAGGARLETLRVYTRDAITGAAMGNLTVDSIATEYGPIERFPWFDSEMAITINEHYTLGSSPFE